MGVRQPGDRILREEQCSGDHCKWNSAFRFAPHQYARQYQHHTVTTLLLGSGSCCLFRFSFLAGCVLLDETSVSASSPATFLQVNYRGKDDEAEHMLQRGKEDMVYIQRKL